MTPLSCSAPDSTSTSATVMTALCEKPMKASSALTTPTSTAATSAVSATTS